jgi:hypothetical protein
LVKNHASEVGAWSEAFRIAFTMAQNSAGAERVFSLPRSCSEETKATPFPTILASQKCLGTTTPSVLLKLANKAEIYHKLRKETEEKSGKMAEKRPKKGGMKSPFPELTTHFWTTNGRKWQSVREETKEKWR